MKTKQTTKNRQREREFEVAVLDGQNEFEEVIPFDCIDELAMSEIPYEDE
jgi:hypothetical protein